MFLRSVLVWLLLAVIAVLNGVLRNFLIAPAAGEHAGHVISTVLLCSLIFFVTFLLIRWLGPGSRCDAAMIGLMWVLMTLAFEFLAGHYLFGHPWERLLADYNLARGRVWVLVLVVTFFSPMISAGVRKPA